MFGNMSDHSGGSSAIDGVFPIVDVYIDIILLSEILRIEGGGNNYESRKIMRVIWEGYLCNCNVVAREYTNSRYAVAIERRITAYRYNNISLSKLKYF